nr:flagellar basal body rod C-terminal domain-containing protein [Pseudomonadota bacterium]
AADENGYVKMPNVNTLLELADMRETNRSYEANLKVMTQAREMVMRNIDLLRN